MTIFPYKTVSLAVALRQIEELMASQQFDRVIDYCEHYKHRYGEYAYLFRGHLAKALLRVARTDEAFDVLNESFQADPDRNTYKALRQVGKKRPDWLQKKGQAIAYLHLCHPERRAACSALVDILIAEQEPMLALRYARREVCWPAQWLRLAEALTLNHPIEAQEIYHEELWRLLKGSTDQGSMKKIDIVLRQMQTIASRIGKTHVFEVLIAEIRSRWNSKRGVQQVLDKGQFPASVVSDCVDRNAWQSSEASPNGASHRATNALRRSVPVGEDPVAYREVQHWGPERWKTIQGVVFCHWDRWLLRIAVSEKNGLKGIRQDFYRRIPNKINSGWEFVDVESKYAQIVDLEKRLTALRLLPYEVLSPDERKNAWLLELANRRVYRSDAHERTEVMERTPRRLYYRRAMRGHWGNLPVSPEPYAQRLLAIMEPSFDEDTDLQSLATLLDIQLSRWRQASSSEAERFAGIRALMSVMLENAHRFWHPHDLLLELREPMQWCLQWLGVQKVSEQEHLFRDVMEFYLWDEFGFLAGLTDILMALDENEADCAYRILVHLIRDYRAYGLGYRLSRALSLRGKLFLSLGKVDE